jgi:hypothetical protein
VRLPGSSAIEVDVEFLVAELSDCFGVAVGELALQR